MSLALVSSGPAVDHVRFHSGLEVALMTTHLTRSDHVLREGVPGLKVSRVVAENELILSAVPHHARIPHTPRVLDFEEGSACAGVNHSACAVKAERHKKVVFDDQLQ